MISVIILTGKVSYSFCLQLSIGKWNYKRNLGTVQLLQTKQSYLGSWWRCPLLP